MYRVRQQVRCGSGLHRRCADHLPEVFGQAPQVVQLRRRGVQGQRLLPHRQPGIVEEFGARRLRVVGVGQIGGVREVSGVGKVGGVGKVEFIDFGFGVLRFRALRFGVLRFGVLGFERLRPGTGLELGYPQPVAYPLTRNSRRALP
jgi:hypothetical protein